MLRLNIKVMICGIYFSLHFNAPYFNANASQKYFNSTDLSYRQKNANPNAKNTSQT